MDLTPKKHPKEVFDRIEAEMQKTDWRIDNRRDFKRICTDREFFYLIHEMNITEGAYLLWNHREGINTFLLGSDDRNELLRYFDQAFGSGIIVDLEGDPEEAPKAAETKPPAGNQDIDAMLRDQDRKAG